MLYDTESVLYTYPISLWIPPGYPSSIDLETDVKAE
jgi:hypothetical protein